MKRSERYIATNDQLLETLGLTEEVARLHVSRIRITIEPGDLPTLVMEMPVSLLSKEPEPPKFDLYEACVEVLVQIHGEVHAMSGNYIHNMWDPRKAREVAVAALARRGVHRG